MFKILGNLLDSNEKELRRLKPLVDRINALEPSFEKLSAGEMRARTQEFREKIAQATAATRRELEEARRELDELRRHAGSATWEVEKDETSRRSRELEEKIKRLEAGARRVEEEALNEILPEAFALVREAAKRTLGQRHYDVQLMGGIVLHQGKIAEMKTGEGKTLVATLPLYLNSLTGRGVHLVTVNDYLARRDPYWMGPIYHALGVSVASIYPMQSPDEHTPARLYDSAYDSGRENDRWRHFRPISRREAYQADITYGTSAEFGFDYLRDNMVTDLSQCVQRPLFYAIVDEVDNLLIDEARTPLIISGPAEDTSGLYRAVNDVVSRFRIKVLPHEPSPVTRDEDEEAALEAEYDAVAYEKEHHVRATARGQEKLARAFRIPVEELFVGEGNELLSPEEARLRTAILSIFRQALSAHALYKRDRDYVVENGEVVIVDEFTGRKMYGRRYSEGLHQAIEAKEHVKVQRESATYATITIQNYFRMYQKLAGMTGTAETEAEEFYKIYKLEVTVIPTHKPMIRRDLPDLVYKTEAGKFRAVVGEIKRLHEQGVPVLVGTVSIEKSEHLRDLLKRQGISCQVLNAKEHVREGEIIAHAGEPGMVTVATNMAGRGVDIVLGGKPPEKPETDDPAALRKYEEELARWQKNHDRVVALGGLHVIGTERHEARRIDNQLRGRAGRQGDPGCSRFYISLEDDIIRRFGGDRVKAVMGWVGLDEDTPIENRLITNMITDVQKRVEGYHFDMRKHLVEYDDVVNKHRELIYEERRKILSGANLKANILAMIRREIADIVAAHTGQHPGDEPDIPRLLAEVRTVLPLPRDIDEKEFGTISRTEIEEKLAALAGDLYEQKEKEMGAERMRVLERLLMLEVIDRLWIEHLTAMEQMRLDAGWQTLRQVRSVDAYRSMGYQRFQMLIDSIRHEIARMIYRVSLTAEEKKPQSPMARAGTGSRGNFGTKTPAAGPKKVGRNDPCPCGSGKKYKHCHGR